MRVSDIIYTMFTSYTVASQYRYNVLAGNTSQMSLSYAIDTGSPAAL